MGCLPDLNTVGCALRPVHHVACRPHQVRGGQYLTDKKKVEADGTEAELLNVDLVETEEKVARSLESRV